MYSLIDDPIVVIIDNVKNMCHFLFVCPRVTIKSPYANNSWVNVKSWCQTSFTISVFQKTGFDFYLM